jgi:hypothetical protein
VSAVVLNAGALLAIDRGDRAMAARLMAAQRDGQELRSNGAVIAQVWRDPSGRQANVARLLPAVDVRAVDRRLGQDAGVISARAGAVDAVDATVVPVANAGDRIITSDPDDIQALVTASRRPILVVGC